MTFLNKNMTFLKQDMAFMKKNRAEAPVDGIER